MGAQQSINGQLQRRFADPGPVCCCALAASNFIAGAYNLQSGGITNPTVLVCTAALCGGATQFLGGMWLFANNNVDATIVTSYGAFWCSWAFIFDPNSGIAAAYTDANELQAALGFYNLAWTIFTFIMLLSNVKTNWVNILMICSLLMTYGIQAVAGLSYHLSASRSAMMMRVSGFFGFTTAFLAWWTVIALMCNKKSAYFELTMFPVEADKKDGNKDEIII
ncbi:hypothetical protein HDU98_012333 [Podochytrium sp. JEL0797]|nr:hypothetical protein HDU98_012333 [Podochytrium sp. JEL0797]